MHRARKWVLFLALAIAAGARAAPPAAEVVSLEGKGERREAQQSTWRPVGLKEPLFATNFVRTLDMSRMAILFVDRTQVRLSQNSVLQIKEAATGPDAKTILNLNKGRSWGQAKTPPRDLTIETPAVQAAIRGTDWEISVEDDGRTTLAVFSGAVELYNDHGRVMVAANEQASAERGKAPVKLVLRTSRSRIQWVSSFTVDPLRYREFREAPAPVLGEIAGLVREQRLQEAYDRTARAAQAQEPKFAAVDLVLADFEIYRGETGRAQEALNRGKARYPADERFEVGLARIALFEDRLDEARGHVQAALAKRRDSVDALVALGDIERQDGKAREALSAYGRAVSAASGDARGWYGLGVVEGERENVRRARSNLEKAIALDASEPAHFAELGTVEGFAGDYASGRAALEKALALQPDHYVALTGLGVLELKAGNAEAAMDALLRATLIEPRYARAHLYLAAAYYQLERDAAALETLKRAAELDPSDPLPHLLSSIVHLDRIEPGRSADAAREALKRMPYLKSLNQVANNQKGVANVGYPLAFMGLEAWARSAAQESYLPFWGGSHLFLADRYPGDFNRRSELMQGFVTDPLAFGGTNRFQSLFLVPGHHATVSMRHARTDDLRLNEPVVTLNGYDARRVPLAYFLEASDTRIEPANLALDARGRTFTAAIGAKPVHELATFLYANRLSVDADIGRPDETGDFTRIDGTVSRVDAGLRYAPDSQSSLWVKGGAGDEDSDLDQVTSILLPARSLSRQLFFTLKTRAGDGAVRYTRAQNEALEWTVGLETSRVRSPRFLTRDAAFHFPEQRQSQEIVDQVDRDRSHTAYAIARVGSGALRGELGVAWRDYRKDRDIRVSRESAPGADQFLREEYRRRKADPMAGVAWRFTSGSLLRAACRRWLRPAALDTMMPVATAGIPLDDQLVFSGGELEQCRIQAEWTGWRDTFVGAFVERAQVRNLVSPLDGVLNTGADTTNLERLRNRVLNPPPNPDLLEEAPVYAQGEVRRVNLAVERIVIPTLGVRAHYTFTESENTGPFFPGLRIPYLARHQTHLGLTWAPGWRTVVTAHATYRSRRYADEANAVLMPGGWDASVNVFVESRDKRWAVEGFAANLLKKEISDVFGIVVSYRF